MPNTVKGFQLFFSLMLLNFCSAQDARQDSCNAAIDAVLVAGQLFAGINNRTFNNPVRNRNTPGVSPDLQARWNSATANLLQLASTRQSDLNNFFSAWGSSAGWASRTLQTVVAHNQHMPISTLGELSYLANTIQRAYSPSNHAALADAWYATAMSLVDNTRAQLDNVTDEISLRSLHFKSTLYRWVASWPFPPGNKTGDVYPASQQSFQAAQDFFPTYQWLQFNYTYSNGTANQTFAAGFVSPSQQKNPVIIITGNVYNWKENAFLRYGISALRRNYAVVYADYPGHTSLASLDNAIGMSSDYTPIIESMLSTLSSQYSDLADLSKVYVLAVVGGSYPSIRACQNLGASLAGCIFNPPVVDHGLVFASAIGRTLFSALQAVANSSSESLPSQSLVQQLSSPVTSIMLPLLLNCSSDSQAGPAVAAALNARGYDPELGVAMVSALGSVAPATFEGVHTAAWASVRRMVLDAPRIASMNITVPTFIATGDQDVSYGGQENMFWDMLPAAAKQKGFFRVYTGISGAALGAQVGGTSVFEADMYTWLRSL